MTLKNIPDDIYDRVRESAKRNHRSINSEIIHLLECGTGSNLMSPEDHLAAAETLRETAGAYRVTGAEVTAAKTRGRK
jgi:plasmid stability protein